MSSLIIYIAQAVVTFLALTVAYFLWSYQYWSRKNVPYLKPRIPFGNLTSLLRRNAAIGIEVADLYRKAKSKGYEYCGIYTLTSPVLLPIDLNMAKLILSRDFHHFTDRGIYYNEKYDPITGNLFLIGGMKWKNLRAKLTPTFTSGKMKSMFPTLVASAENLEIFMEKEIMKREAIDIKSVLAKYSTDIIGSCAFGLECNCFEDSNSLFNHYGPKVFQRSRYQVLMNVISSNFPNVAKFFGVKVFADDVSDFYFKVVMETVEYRRKNNVVRPDFLQLLINILEDEEKPISKVDGKTITMTEAVAQCFVFFLAGFETSSTTMTFALFELARDQDIQEKLRQEIIEVLEKHNNQITYDSVKEMKYLGQVIDETLRKYPPLALITRECVEPWKIPNSNVIIDKGTTVFIPIIAYHYDTDYYKDPEVFEPDRFSDENKQHLHQYAHIPFGEGPRLCIGMRFGLMQSKVGLISILRNYKVTLNSKTKVPIELDKNSFVITTKGGMWLDFEKI